MGSLASEIDENGAAASGRGSGEERVAVLRANTFLRRFVGGVCGRRK
jgi:hypothetical protein